MFDKKVDITSKYGATKVTKQKQWLGPTAAAPKKHKKTAKKRRLTEEQARFVYDMKLARHLRAITRDE